MSRKVRSVTRQDKRQEEKEQEARKERKHEQDIRYVKKGQEACLDIGQEA